MLVGRRTAHNRASFEPRKGQMINGKYSLYRKCMHAWLQMKLVVASLVILILCKRQAETPCARGIQERAEKRNEDPSAPHRATCSFPQLLRCRFWALWPLLWRRCWTPGQQGWQTVLLLSLHHVEQSCEPSSPCTVLCPPGMFLSAVALGSAWMKFSDKRNFCQKCWSCSFSLRELETSCLDLQPHCPVSLLAAFFRSPPELASHQLVLPAHWHTWKQIYFFFFLSLKGKLSLILLSWLWNLDPKTWCHDAEDTISPCSTSKRSPGAFRLLGILAGPTPTHHPPTISSPCSKACEQQGSLEKNAHWIFLQV